MARSSNVDPYLVPIGRGELSFHQGVVVEWDSITNDNVINVAGTDVPDVPVLSTADAIMMAVGNVVALLRYRSTYFIVGRVALPGITNAFGMRTGSVALIEGTTSTTFTDLATTGPTVTATVSTSRRVLVIASSFISAANNTGSFAVEISGASTIAPSNQGDLTSNTADAIQATITMQQFTQAFDGLNPGLNTFTMKYKVTNGAGGIVTFAQRVLTVFPF